MTLMIIMFVLIISISLYVQTLVKKLQYAFVIPFMKTYMPLLIAILILQGCGDTNKHSVPLIIRVYEVSNPIFYDNIESFYSEQLHWSGIETRKDVPINFVADDYIPPGYTSNNNNYHGTCIKYELSNGEIVTREIFIKENYWNNVDEIAQQYLIFHELGHCILDRDHFDDFFITSDNKKIYVSIMSTYVSGEMLENYENYYDGYMQELFTQETTLLEELIDENQ